MALNWDASLPEDGKPVIGYAVVQWLAVFPSREKAEEFIQDIGSSSPKSILRVSMNFDGLEYEF